MLVLSRKAGESIVIGTDVVVTVLEVRGDLVRVGIEAPRSVSVNRKEIHDELTAANVEASGSAAIDVGRLPKPHL